MATELHFALPSALRLAEHALAAPAHLPSLSEQDDAATCAGALEWVADDGTYLMSNGTPALLSDPHDPTSNIVVHAEGWGPGSDRHWLGLSGVGFDDFTEHLHLTDGDPPLIDLLRAAAHHGYPWLVLTVNGDALTAHVSRTGPPDAP
jgi:hypothetical protein